MNLFDPLPNPLNEEVLFELLRHESVRIEQIVSNGQASPDGFWYDQDEHEWVSLLAGEGEIEFANGERRHLRAGDVLNLPAHTRHRVASVSQSAVWLAVFYGFNAAANRVKNP